MANHLHEGDLPDGLDLGPVVAIDSETMGLNPHRDRLCVVQLSGGDGNAHLVRFARGNYAAPNLKAMLADSQVLKLFHFARFDVAVLQHYLGVTCRPVYCTKIASKLVRTYTDRHGLKDLCRELLGVDLSKQQQSSDWGAATLSPEQIDYAASDVLHLHRLRDILDGMLAREERADVARACFDFLPTRAALDLGGWAEEDIFAH
jgi:ribonuclease D